MVKMRGAGTFFFVLFLDCCLLPGLLDTDTFPLLKGSNTELSSNSNNLEEGLAKIFDDILLQVVPRVPFDETRRKAGKSWTERVMKEGSNTELSSNSNNLEEGLAKIFDEIRLQVSSNAHGTRTAGKSVTKRAMKERNIPTNDQRYNPFHMENSVQTLQRPVGHISEKKSKGPSLVNRAASEQLATVDQGALEEAANPDSQNRAMPCAQLLSFLQRNIVVAVVSVAGILGAVGLLLLVLILHARRKQPLHPPANITYNIFIMNEKTWWHKPQEKNSKEFAGKQRPLNCDSRV